MNQHSGSVTLPRGFRCPGLEAPKTPEPFAQNDEAQMPSPPKPRLRLKRRVVSQLAAPTQHFLASVAAADVPIPSIEEPEPDSMDSDMLGFDAFRDQSLTEDSTMLLVHPRGRAFSPPKTPAPAADCVPPLSPKRYPQWSIDSAISSSVESTPEYESSRPSTARSTQTSSSLFSHISQISDDDHFLGSEVDCKEKFTFLDDDEEELRDASSSKRKARKAPWTKAMSDHLWSTFTLYLQDPKVTPVRMGKSGIPPQGVCLRVAREAKRSWKGAKALAKAPAAGEGRKSGSSTPTAESSGTFIQWPHTCAATRAHLRELCRLKATSGPKNHRFISRSPTPFTHSAARHWNRRSTPARNPFTQDMTMSLAISTSESMQPQGPLAQLTRASPEPVEPVVQPALVQPALAQPALAGQALSTFEGEPSFAERQRLGSPFGARSYGPSSSGSLAAVLGLTGPMPRRQNHTVGPRRTLQSPVRLSRSGTQKRRNTQSSEPRKRPSIGSDLWAEPSAARPRSQTNAGTEFSSTNLNQRDELFIPRIPFEPVLNTSTSMPDVSAPQLASPLSPPARLGSPFSGSSSSFSFPNRLHRTNQGASVDLGSLGRSRQFATIQQFTEPSALQRQQPPAPRGNLAGRLAYIDQRLKEIKQQKLRRRSESPL